MYSVNRNPIHRKRIVAVPAWKNINKKRISSNNSKNNKAAATLTFRRYRRGSDIVKKQNNNNNGNNNNDDDDEGNLFTEANENELRIVIRIPSYIKKTSDLIVKVKNSNVIEHDDIDLDNNDDIVCISIISRNNNNNNNNNNNKKDSNNNKSKKRFVKNIHLNRSSRIDTTQIKARLVDDVVILSVPRKTTTTANNTINSTITENREKDETITVS